jgi:VIT1/CCC1 family predicted Fe2+/Mn2+ transporter
MAPATSPATPATSALAVVALALATPMIRLAVETLQVADQLMAKDALGAHARDELGISEVTAARPILAALASAAAFSIGAIMPLAMVLLSPPSQLVAIVSIASLLFLAVLGAIGARAGGANVLKATARVTFWGALAMALTAGIGAIFGTVS